MIFDAAWDLMKADIFHEGRAYSSMDDLMPELNQQIEGWGGSNKKLSPFPFPYKSGNYRHKSWKGMLERGLDDFITSNPGFQSSDEMLPAMMPWIGGKTQIQPYVRGLADFFPNARPAELYGGSGSTILGLNRGTGFYADINPDNTNAFQHLKDGLGVIEIPKTRDRMNEMISRMNDLRFRRDVRGEQLSSDELRELASNYIATNHQAFGNLNYPQSQTQRAKYPEWYGGTGYTEGPILNSGWRRSSQRIMPHRVGALDLSAYPDRMRDVEIHTGDLRDTVNLLEGDEFLYLDPQYIDRQIQYGGSDEQQSGGGYDQLQRDTIRIGGEHDGPVLYSNYLVGPKHGNPNYDMVSDLLDSGFDLHTWMRKPKQNKTPVVEVLGLRNFPEHVQRASPNKNLFDF
jgi:site-specific DNA-adenine methylase